jgi:hypothetical protein
MDKFALAMTAHIAAKNDEKAHYQKLWQSIVALNEQHAFSMDCYLELKARISTKVAQCDRSIHDHKKLLYL